MRPRASKEVQTAVGLWARRVGPSAVFDRDDATQEAMISEWRTGGCGASLYRDIIDVLRGLVPNFRRGGRAMVALDAVAEVAHMDSPDQLMQARQRFAAWESLGATDRRCLGVLMGEETKAEAAAGLGLSPLSVEWRCSHLRSMVRS
jgi:hypothetical protein